MGLLSSSSSSSSTYTDARNNVDYSQKKLDENSSAVDLASIYDSKIDLTLTDNGAVSQSLDFGTQALSAVTDSSSAALQQASQISADAIEAVQKSSTSDTQAVLNRAMTIGGVVLLGLGAVFLFVKVKK